MDNKIKVRLRGTEQDSEHVRLSEFIKQLESVRIALKHTEHLISHSKESVINYLITDLTHSSPATVSIEAYPISESDIDMSEAVISKFTNGIRTLVIEKKAPIDFDRSTLEAYKGLTSGLSKHIAELTIIDGVNEIPVSNEIEYVIEHAIGPDILAEGVIKGSLEAINVHSKTSFNIYPDIGSKRVQCNFSQAMFSEVKSALRQYVVVSGMMKSKSLDPFPYEMDVKEISICPLEETLPTLWDLRGTAKNGFGDKDSVEFVRALRDTDG